MHQQYTSLTSSYSYRRALPSAVAVSVKTTFENNAILALTRIGRVSSSTLLNDERFMSLLCHILNNDIRHLPLLTISASTTASKSQDSTLVHTVGKDKKEESLDIDNHVKVTTVNVNTSLLPPLVHTPAARTVTPSPVLIKRKAIKRKATEDKDAHDDDENVNLQSAAEMKDSKIMMTKQKRFVN
jgi:hypothetical protein